MTFWRVDFPGLVCHRKVVIFGVPKPRTSAPVGRGYPPLWRRVFSSFFECLKSRLLFLVPSGPLLRGVHHFGGSSLGCGPRQMRLFESPKSGGWSLRGGYPGGISQRGPWQMRLFVSAGLGVRTRGGTPRGGHPGGVSRGVTQGSMCHDIVAAASVRVTSSYVTRVDDDDYFWGT